MSRAVSMRRAAPWVLPLVIALIGSVLWYLNHRHDENRHRAEQAKKVVSSHLAGLFTYDYKSLAADLAQHKAWMTDGFAAKYGALVAKTVEPAAAKTKLSTKATVVSSGVVSNSRDDAKLLMFLDVTTQSTDLAQPKLTGSRMLVTTTFVDGSWRISAIDPV